MTQRSKLIAGGLSALAVLVTIAAIASYVGAAFAESCEVCITFNGRTTCREAYAKTREEAIETATDNACALMAGGMTDSIQCSNSKPDRVTCAE